MPGDGVKACHILLHLFITAFLGGRPCHCSPLHRGGKQRLLEVPYGYPIHTHPTVESRTLADFPSTIGNVLPSGGRGLNEAQVSCNF